MNTLDEMIGGGIFVLLGTLFWMKSWRRHRGFVWPTITGTTVGLVIAYGMIFLVVGIVRSTILISGDSSLWVGIVNRMLQTPFIQIRTLFQQLGPLLAGPA